MRTAWISDLFLGQHADVSSRADLIHHSGQGRFAIRIGDWNYLDWPGSGGYVSPDTNPEGLPNQLFDVARDPEEKHNLSASEPERVARMQAALQKSRQPRRRCRRAGTVQ